MRNLEECVQHLKQLNYNPPVVIDVGVAWGTFELYQTFPESYFILIEALDYFKNDLEKITSHVEGEYHLFAVGDESDEIQISLDITPQTLAAANVIDKPNHGDQTFNVVVRPLDVILSETNIPAGSLLKLDVQGADLRALRGGGDTLVSCDVVIVEASLRNEMNLVRHIVNHMSDEGFVLYDIVDALNRPFDNALGQVDLAFVREGHELVKYKGWA